MVGSPPPPRSVVVVLRSRGPRTVDVGPGSVLLVLDGGTVLLGDGTEELVVLSWEILLVSR